MVNQAAQESYTEKNYANAVIYLLEKLGYTHYYGPDFERDYRDPFFPEDDEMIAHIEKYVKTHSPYYVPPKEG